MTAPRPAERAWIVCGGRDYASGARVRDVLDALAEQRGRPDVVRHGGATGADSWGVAWACVRGIQQIAYQPDWHAHGRAAGPIRNAAMLAAGADLVIAFPGGKGTADMVAKARAAGVEVIEVAQ